MYKEVINGLYYSIAMDLGVSYGLFYDYITKLTPTFLFVLGIKIGSHFLKQCIQ